MEIAVGGQQGRALREIGQDRVRFRDRAAVVQLQGRDGAGRIDLEVGLGPALVLENRDGLRPVGDFQMAQQDADLPAVLRGQVVIER